MENDMQAYIRCTYVPTIGVERVTARHTLGRIPVAEQQKPEHVCGIARRIGYTGTLATDLAIYRIKVKNGRQNTSVTIPVLYVVEDGVFMDYEVWRHAHEMCTERTMIQR